MRLVLLAIMGILLTVYAEIAIFPVPFPLLFLVLVSVFVKKSWVFFLALFAGILMDSLRFLPLGETALFYVCVLGIIFLYGRKFEIENTVFIGVITFAASLFYFLIFGFTYLFLQLFLVVVLLLLVFAGMSVVSKIQARVV